ncbi:TIGR00296 family protein [Candidatus Altiarchaeota archaeon]
MTLSQDQGVSLVRYARCVIESYYQNKSPSVPENLIDVFQENRGVFVTLQRHPSHDLRGCIGFSEPIFKLGVAVTKAALAAALEDPRFPSVEESELGNLTIEVSVLTVPEEVKVDKPQDYVKEIVIGRDGLIVEYGMFKGLLLPQVPVEWKWEVEEFLSHTCMKAGLLADDWLAKPIKLYKFSAQIFSEKEPKGEVAEKEIGEE